MWINLDEVTLALRDGDGAGIKVAIIDSGVEILHPLLQGLSVSDDLAFVKSGPQLKVVDGKGIDQYGHGTAIASIIHRVAPAASIGSFQVLNERLGSTSDVIAFAVREAIARGYHLLSCSFGCPGTERYLLRYKEWIDEAYLHGVHIVSACNNNNVAVKEWPAYFPSVIAVNMAKSPEATLFYRRGGRMVEFAAHGTDLELPWLGGKTIKGVSGSSYAAPLVAGLLARLLGCHPSLSPLAAKALLQSVAIPWSSEIAAENEF